MQEAFDRVEEAFTIIAQNDPNRRPNDPVDPEMIKTVLEAKHQIEVEKSLNMIALNGLPTVISHGSQDDG